MEGTSSFAQIDAPLVRGWKRLGQSTFGALEGAATSIPLSLGCATLVFDRVAPELVGSGVFATMLALFAIHVTTAGSKRPVCFSARIFEATTLAAMLDHLIPQLAQWGLADTVGVRLAFLCAICGGAGAVMCLLYVLRAERLTTFIPAPVFAGFSNSISLALLFSQWHVIRQLVGHGASLVPVACIVATSFGVAFGMRRWLPGRPASAAGLAAGLLAGAVWAAGGQPQAAVGGGLSAVLPVFLADFGAFRAPGVQLWPVTLIVLGNAAILGTMVFINTALASQTLTQFDRVQGNRIRDGVVAGATVMAGGLAGSAPLSGSIMACLAMSRTAQVRLQPMLLLAGVVALVWFTHVLSVMPLAAVVGVLLCESWALADRPSLRLARDWLRRRPLPANAKEDLALIFGVTVIAVVTNMVVAAFAGLVFGLFMVAARSARIPVRHVWHGGQMSSNCARGSVELRILAQHGPKLRVFELEGDMFFAVGASLDRSLQESTRDANCAVLDWSRVRHIDSSVAAVVASFERHAGERGILVVHAGAAAQPRGNVADELRRHIPGLHLAADLDYALELAENHLILEHQHDCAADASSVFDAMHLFDGMSVEERATLEHAMTQKLFRAGEVILRAGDESNEMMLILQGAASIVVANSEGQPVRLAGARRGALIGEIAFLDGSARSATVVAQSDVVTASLDRDTFERLSRTGDPVVPKLLSNIAVALARRLRHTNHLALARSRTH